MNIFDKVDELNRQIRELELQQRVTDLERVLFRLHSNAAESEDWIRREIETVLKVEYGFQKESKVTYG